VDLGGIEDRFYDPAYSRRKELIGDDLDVHHLGVGSDAGGAEPVIGRGDRPRHHRGVAVIAHHRPSGDELHGLAGDERFAQRQVEIRREVRVGCKDAGVDHGHADPLAGHPERPRVRGLDGLQAPLKVDQVGALGYTLAHLLCGFDGQQLHVGVGLRDRIGNDRTNAGDALGLRGEIQVGRGGHGQPDLREALDHRTARFQYRLGLSVREVVACGNDQVLLLADRGDGPRSQCRKSGNHQHREDCLAVHIRVSLRNEGFAERYWRKARACVSTLSVTERPPAQGSVVRFHRAGVPHEQRLHQECPRKRRRHWPSRFLSRRP